MRNTLLSKKIRNTLRKKQLKKKLFVLPSSKKKKKKKTQKICKRASLPRKKSPTSILNNILQTQSKDKKQGTWQQTHRFSKILKKLKTKTQYILQPNLKKPEQQIHQVKQNQNKAHQQQQPTNDASASSNAATEHSVTVFISV